VEYGINNHTSQLNAFFIHTKIPLTLILNTADVTGGKPIAVLLPSISAVSAINPLVAFYYIHGGKRDILLFILSRGVVPSRCGVAPQIQFVVIQF
jgi:hypothetical protein